MNTPVDFEAVRQSRAALAALAQQHPELCQGDGTWGNNLDTLEDIIMTPGKTRMEKYRAKQKARGMKPINIFLTPEAQAALSRLQSERPDATMGDIISDILLLNIPSKPEVP